MIDDRILNEQQYTPEQARELGCTEEEIDEIFSDHDTEPDDTKEPVFIDGDENADWIKKVRDARKEEE